MFKKSREYFIVKTKNNLFVEDSLKKLNKVMNAQLERNEFIRIDGNYVTIMDDEDLNFVQDKKRMANIPWQHLIKKDMTINYLLYGLLAICALILIRG